MGGAPIGGGGFGEVFGVGLGVPRVEDRWSTVPLVRASPFTCRLPGGGISRCDRGASLLAGNQGFVGGMAYDTGASGVRPAVRAVRRSAGSRVFGRKDGASSW